MFNLQKEYVPPVWRLPQTVGREAAKKIAMFIKAGLVFLYYGDCSRLLTIVYEKVKCIKSIYIAGNKAKIALVYFREKREKIRSKTEPSLWRGDEVQSG